MRPFTVTSPTNALSVVVYGMFTFYGAVLITKVTQAISIPEDVRGVWATLMFLSASAALYGVLTAPKRRDPDRSLRIEFYTSGALCILMGYLDFSIATYPTTTGAFPITSFGLCMIFCLGFGARSAQIFFERQSLRKYRESPPQVDIS